MSEYDYNEYYQEEDLFGKPYAGLMEYFEKSPRGTLVDLGAGQGRDSVPLSKMGYAVTSVDISDVGIGQIQQKDNKIIALVDDFYTFDVSSFDYILLDSIVHFEAEDREKESAFIKRLLTQMKQGAVLVNCLIQGEEGEAILKDIIGQFAVETLYEGYLEYQYSDYTFHYHMVAVKKL